MALRWKVALALLAQRIGKLGEVRVPGLIL
jgi:hypothetical protein